METDATQRLGRASGELAFEDFWQRERQGLYAALSLAVGDPTLAGEAVDEAMIRAYQRWSRIGRYDRPAGWVYRVALNWARSRRRRRGRTLPGVSPEPWTDPHPLPDETLWRAVGALPRDQRDVIGLRYQLDWPLEDIADALDIPVGTAKSRLHRGLERLRQDLEASP